MRCCDCEFRIYCQYKENDLTAFERCDRLTAYQKIVSAEKQQAVKEFAEKLKENLNAKRIEMQQSSPDSIFDKASNLGVIAGLLWSIEFVDTLLTEL